MHCGERPEACHQSPSWMGAVSKFGMDIIIIKHTPKETIIIITHSLGRRREGRNRITCSEI